MKTMDCRSSFVCKSRNREYWKWKGVDCIQQKSCIVTLNQEDHSYMNDEETTPIKECGDLAYNTTQSENRYKHSDEYEESSSLLKRRRTLYYDGNPSQDEEMAFLKSNETMDMSDWGPSFSEYGNVSNFEGLDLSTEGWITECLNENEMLFSPPDPDMTYSSTSSDIEIDLSEFCNFSPEKEVNIDQPHIKQTPPKVIFKGKKSIMRTPTKLAASVAYPFAFIKPCGFQGDTTLKDINQLIHTPPPKPPKQKKEEALLVYPTSAFSGKPVVGKAKIHTDGGRGSITIMRTKG